MTEAQAVTILIKIAQRELKRLAFNANLADRCGLNELVFRQASRERRWIREAIEVLEHLRRLATLRSTRRGAPASRLALSQLDR